MRFTSLEQLGVGLRGHARCSSEAFLTKRTQHHASWHTSLHPGISGQAHQLRFIHLLFFLLFAFLTTRVAASSDTLSQIDSTDGPTEEDNGVLLLERLFRSGVFKVAGQAGLKGVDELVSRGDLRVGALSGTNGRVFELNTAVPRQCLRPDSVVICAWCRNVGHVINEWLVYHLWTVGVNHVVVHEDHSSDNTRAVLKPWSDAGLVSVREANRSVPAESQWRSYTSCFQEFGSRYTWTAFIDIDEFIMPLSKPCLPDLLDAYSAHGGLSVGHSYTASPRLYARRNRMTIFEATNFTLGYPHPLVKAICYNNHTLGARYVMPHCCDYREGYTNVDETFANDPRDECYVIPYGRGYEPRQHITVVHAQASSFEEMVQRRIRKTELPPHDSSLEFAEGVNLTSVWRQFKQANQEVMQKGLQPSAAVLKRMKRFRYVLNQVLMGRDMRDNRYYGSATLKVGHEKAVEFFSKLFSGWRRT